MSGSISIPNLPSNFRVPGVFVGSSPAGTTAGLNQVGLIIGQMLSSGTATAGSPVLAYSQSNVNALTGATSMIAAQYAMAIQNAPSITWYLLPLADASGSTASTWTLPFAVSSPTAGSVIVLIDNTPVAAAVTSTSTATTLATAMAAAINANGTLTVTATASAGSVTLTSTNKGLTAGQHAVEVAPHGASQGQQLPSGVTCVPTFTAGTVDPDLASALPNVAGLGALYAVNPYATSTDLGETSAFEQTQWLITNDKYGQVFSASQGNVASLVTTGALYNDQYLSIISTPLNALQPAYLWATAYCAAAANSFAADPSLPLTGVILNGIAPPVLATSNFQKSDRNTLYNSGIASYKVEGGFVYIDLPVTTYQKTSTGIADSSYLLSNTPAQLTLVSETFRTKLATDFKGKKVVNDPATISGYNNLVTPKLIGAHICGYYADMAASGLVTNTAAFNAGLVVQLGANQGQVLVYAPITLSSPLEQIDVQIVFGF